MSNETMRFFFPLKIITYPQYDCSEDDQEELSPAETVSYEDQILAAISKENRNFKNERGLAEYLDKDVLQEKVRSLHPSVEVWNGELTQDESAELISQVEGQDSDGWGEGFEQRPIKTPDGEIYVSFWNHENYSLKLEQEMKNSSPDLGYGGQVMG